MGAYNSTKPCYDVFGINMTVDTKTSLYSRGMSVCQSCQCNCQSCFGCRTGISGSGLEKISQKEAEKVLKTLLVA